MEAEKSRKMAKTTQVQFAIENKDLIFQAVGASSVGRVRLTNEDEWSVMDEGRFCAIADGMGGSPGGKVAAKAVMTFLGELLEREKPKPGVKILVDMVKKVNHRLFDMSRKHSSLKGMGATLTALWASEEALFWAHAGDSRLYHIFEDKIELVSTDHVTYRLRKAPHSKAAHSLTYTYTSRMLTRVIGTQPQIEVDHGSLPMAAGAKYLLCTDGLTDRLSNQEIHQTLVEPVSLEKKVEKLVELANLKGGEDNITVILIDVDYAKNLFGS